MEATFVLSDRGVENSSRYRIRIPAKYLIKAGHNIRVIHRDYLHSETKISDVVLIERELSPDNVNELRALGAKRIILTFDDAYHLIPPRTAGHGYWKGQTRQLDYFKRALDMIDLSIVPSLGLAAYYDSKYIPNYHDLELWPTSRNDRPEGLPLVVGWGGSGGHAKTWENMDIVKGIRLAQSDLKFDLKVYGGVADKSFYGSGLNFTSHEWVPFEEWPWKICEFDIMLAPLSGEYDMFRSNLRLIESGIARIPFVATNEGEYKNAPGGVLVSNDHKMWVRALTHLVKNKDSRLKLGEIGEAWSKRYLMPERVSEYENILWGMERKNA